MLKCHLQATRGQIPHSKTFRVIRGWRVINRTMALVPEGAFGIAVMQNWATRNRHSSNPRLTSKLFPNLSSFVNRPNCIKADGKTTVIITDLHTVSCYHCSRHRRTVPLATESDKFMDSGKRIIALLTEIDWGADVRRTLRVCFHRLPVIVPSFTSSH